MLIFKEYSDNNEMLITEKESVQRNNFRRTLKSSSFHL